MGQRRNQNIPRLMWKGNSNKTNLWDEVKAVLTGKL